jgi:PAS domain S-box-containing protein
MDEDSLTLLEHAAALTQERNMFDRILRHVSAAIALVDAEHALRYINPAWEFLHNQRANDIINMPVRWPSITDHPDGNAALDAAITHHHPWQGHAEFSRPDGLVMRVSMTVQPVFDAEGRPDGYVITQHTIGVVT